jgi:hypothetical protein
MEVPQITKNRTLKRSCYITSGYVSEGNEVGT